MTDGCVTGKWCLGWGKSLANCSNIETIQIVRLSYVDTKTIRTFLKIGLDRYKAVAREKGKERDFFELPHFAQLQKKQIWIFVVVAIFIAF